MKTLEERSPTLRNSWMTTYPSFIFRYHKGYFTSQSFTIQLSKCFFSKKKKWKYCESSWWCTTLSSPLINAWRIGILHNPSMLKYLFQRQTLGRILYKHLYPTKNKLGPIVSWLYFKASQWIREKTWLMRSLAADETTGLAGNLRSTCTILSYS